jgi:hypothetical protein
MPSYLLHRGAQVECVDKFPALPTVSNPRVRVSGQDTILQGTLYAISCTTNPKCVTGTFPIGASRVRSFGVALVLTTSSSTTVPKASAPLNVVSSQTRVKAQ